MEGTEVRKLAALEETHWWYRERRALLAKELARLGKPGTALDIGAAGGGNTQVLKAHGWSPIAVEYGAEGAEVAHERGLTVVRADARHLPVADGSVDLVVAFDVLEHIEEDGQAMAEIGRALRPGGTALIAVPCDMRLWSAHDEAVGHVRRYSRSTLGELIVGGGLAIDTMQSWNVMLRPAAAWHRKRSSGSDLSEVAPLTNMLLSATIIAERYLPVKSLPGVSLLVRARQPLTPRA
jgi:SAM-dependent methyltransferase